MEEAVSIVAMYNIGSGDIASSCPPRTEKIRACEPSDTNAAKILSRGLVRMGQHHHLVSPLGEALRYASNVGFDPAD